MTSTEFSSGGNPARVRSCRGLHSERIKAARSAISSGVGQVGSVLGLDRFLIVNALQIAKRHLSRVRTVRSQIAGWARASDVPCFEDDERKRRSAEKPLGREPNGERNFVGPVGSTATKMA